MNWNRESWSLGAGVYVLGQHADGLLALHKPAGVLSHPNRAGDESRSLVQSAYDTEGEYFSAQDGSRLYLLHRLDSPTSGVVLLAIEESLARLVRQSFAERKVRKIYRALVFGVPRRGRELWEERLSRSGGRDQVRSQVTRGGTAASCEMRRICQLPGQPARTLIELMPQTGLSHQLRVQCRRHGLPIVGDRTYGDFAKNRQWQAQGGEDRLMLHAWQIEVSWMTRGRAQKFHAQSPLPQWLMEK